MKLIPLRDSFLCQTTDTQRKIVRDYRQHRDEVLTAHAIVTTKSFTRKKKKKPEFNLSDDDAKELASIGLTIEDLKKLKGKI